MYGAPPMVQQQLMAPPLVHIRLMLVVIMLELHHFLAHIRKLSIFGQKIEISVKKLKFLKNDHFSVKKLELTDMSQKMV